MIEIPPQKPISNLNVLVIDGQSLVHDVIKSALLELGIKQVKSAENAYFALRLCEQMDFDILMVAFDVKSDKDGFNLLEEMKFKGFVKKTTTVIFLSADTSSELVNCVVELQPNDFWVKPLLRQKVKQRIEHILTVKKKLYRLQYCVDQGEYTTAIYYAERQLQDPSLENYFPQINRLIGECLLNLLEFSDAEQFYKKLSQKYKYAWVMVGLARSILKQDKLDEAMALIDKLIERDDTRFATYDILAEYYIEKEDYEKGYEIIKKATALAPRNIERNKKSWNLARLNHDRAGQYTATQNMAKYAKNSIHDSPELTLNVIRAGIDLAATVAPAEANRILTKTERDITALERDYGASNQLGGQLDIIRARIHNVRNEKSEAEKIMADHMDVTPVPGLEDNLDKVKAFHEMGYREESLKLLSQIKSEIESESFVGQVINEYLQQEEEERESIHYTPKELGEMASTHYKNKRYKPAFDSLSQALQLSPQNTNYAISLLKVVAKMSEEQGLNDEQLSSVEKCIKTLEDLTLSEAQMEKKEGYTQRIFEMKDKDNGAQAAS